MPLRFLSYHAWTYDLEGRLRGLRQPAGFADLDKSEYGLLELPAFERYGLIWVRPSVSEAPISIDAWLAPMAEQLASADMASLVVHKAWSVELNMGWRIALEGFQESYHFCSAHKQTACSAYLDNQSVFVDHYPHFRHAVPWRKRWNCSSSQNRIGIIALITWIKIICFPAILCR